MGEWKKSISVTFDAQSRGTLAWAKERFSPLFDDERSQSLMLRFILKQWETYTKVMLAMPDIMQAFVRAQQQLNLPKVAQCVLEFPLRSAAGEGLEQSPKDTSLLKFSRLRYGRAGLVVAAFDTFLSRELAHVRGRVA